MLQPPGSSGARRAVHSGRRKAQETPDDVIRQLQRLPQNKKCADCSSKLPACVNLTIGSFICMTCAGIHREMNARVKGVGHSSFTAEEAEKMKTSDNDKVNAVYLARYNPSVERLKQPQDNSNQQLLKAWIRRKYNDKAWYSPSGEGGQPASQRQQQGGKYGQPTVAQIPPKKQQAPETDLLGDVSASAPAPTPASQGWDAFAPSNQNQQQPPSQQNQPQPAFQANFANFPAPASSGQQQQDLPADFGSSHVRQQATQQPSFQPNFANASPGPQSAQQNFANFGQQLQNAPSTQQQLMTQQAGFANFSSSQPQQPPQQMMPSHQQQQGGFANFNSAQPQQSPQPQQQMAPGQQQQGSGSQLGFANLNQQSPQTNQQHWPQMQQQVPVPQQYQQNQSQTHQQGGFGSFNQHMSPQQNQSQAQQQGGLGSLNKQMSPQPQQQNGSGNAPQPGSMQQQQPPPPIPALQGDRRQVESPATQVSTAASAYSAAEAIPNISVTDKASASEPSAEKPLKPDSKFHSGQIVYYKSASFSGPAKVVKVHFDDDLEPFYTISVDGKEKQTDDAHLSKKNPLQEEVDNLLSTLSESQLKEVQEFVSKLKSVPNENLQHGTASQANGAGSNEQQKSHSQIPSMQPASSQSQQVQSSQPPQMQPSTQQQQPQGAPGSMPAQQVQPGTMMAPTQMQTGAGIASHGQMQPNNLPQKNTNSDNAFQGIPSPPGQPSQSGAQVPVGTVPAPPLSSHSQPAPSQGHYQGQQHMYQSQPNQQHPQQGQQQFSAQPSQQHNPQVYMNQQGQQQQPQLRPQMMMQQQQPAGQQQQAAVANQQQAPLSPNPKGNPFDLY